MLQCKKIENQIGGFVAGKSLSEAPILASTNPKYDDRLFIELQVQYMKISSSEHGKNMVCTEIVLNVKTKTKKQFAYTICSELGIFIYWTCNSMNNLSSYILWVM